MKQLHSTEIPFSFVPASRTGSHKYVHREEIRLRETTVSSGCVSESPNSLYGLAFDPNLSA